MKKLKPLRRVKKRSQHGYETEFTWTLEIYKWSNHQEAKITGVDDLYVVRYWHIDHHTLQSTSFWARFVQHLADQLKQLSEWLNDSGTWVLRVHISRYLAATRRNTAKVCVKKWRSTTFLLFHETSRTQLTSTFDTRRTTPLYLSFSFDGRRFCCRLSDGINPTRRFIVPVAVCDHEWLWYKAILISIKSFFIEFRTIVF